MLHHLFLEISILSFPKKCRRQKSAIDSSFCHRRELCSNRTAGATSSVATGTIHLHTWRKLGLRTMKRKNTLPLCLRNHSTILTPLQPAPPKWIPNFSQVHPKGLPKTLLRPQPPVNNQLKLRRNRRGHPTIVQ